MGPELRFGPSGAIGRAVRTPPLGGEIVEWDLVDATRARASAEPASGGVSLLQADHLRGVVAADAAGRVHCAFVGGMLRFDEPLDPGAMARALTGFVRDHEELRSFYPLSEGSSLRRLVAAPETIEMTVVDGPDASVAGEDLVEWISDRASRRSRPDSFPAVSFGAAGDDTGFTFYYTTDHSHGDGYSLLLALSEVAARYRAQVHGEPVRLSRAGAFGDYVRAERAAAAAVDPTGFGAGRWRDALRANGGRIPAAPLDLGLSGGLPQPAVTVVEHTLLDAAQAQRIDALLVGGEATFAGVLHAALALAYYELSGSTDYFVATVVATRSNGHERTQGWLCNFVPVAFAVDPSATPLAVAATASDALRAARRVSADPVHGVLAVLAAEGTIEAVDGSPQMVSYIDARRLQDPDDPVLGTMMLLTGAGLTRNANVWFTRYADDVAISSLVPDNPTSRRSVTQLIAAVSARLAEFASGAAT